MIKELLRKHLFEYVNEANPMVHFNERISDVVDNIVKIDIPNNLYLPNIPKETQDAWIISQIKTKLKEKINLVINTDFPIGRGICVLIPLGMIKIQPIKGNPTNVLVTAQRSNDIKQGYSYYIGVYDNRLPSIVLADPNKPSNKTPQLQLQNHMYNNSTNGWPVNRTKSYVDKSLMDNILINMSNFPSQNSI